ncbi:MAG: XRE family transcriptional regulator [Planctomycetota bacterium]|nr:MAG: XRE family transcriptional regulator [Planctomycetota bacterium]
MSTGTLHERLKTVAAGQTYRSLGELTRTHPETVRRYMQGQAPSVEFLAGVCRSLGINADWLLTGRGAMRVDEVRAHALREADPSELHAAMARTISMLVDRVDRLEAYCQTLETLVRGRATSARGSAGSEPGSGPTDASGSAAIRSGGDERADPPAVEVCRADRIARAVAKRPRADAD